jgi:hypothetical protein
MLDPAAHDETHRRAVSLTAARERLRAELHARGLRTVNESVGPFLLATHPRRPDLHAALHRLGIAGRRADTFPGLAEGWIRISVRNDDAGETLLGALDHLLNDPPRPEPRPGLVTLVGGGPGPSGQITIDGLLALQHADVLVTDRLAPLAMLDHLPALVEVVDAGKNPRSAARPQEKIDAVVSGHLPPGHPQSLTDWAALARSGTTLAVLMGVATLPSITHILVEAGLPASTPAAIVVDAVAGLAEQLA